MNKKWRSEWAAFYCDEHGDVFENPIGRPGWTTLERAAKRYKRAKFRAKGCYLVVRFIERAKEKP